MGPEPRGKVTFGGRISPSEDPDKVRAAVANVLGGQYEVGVVGDRVTFESSDLGCLDHFRAQLRDRHVRAAARRLLLNGREGSRTTVMLNRQAAAAGVVVLCASPEESPLGPLFVTIESRDLDGVVDWLTSYAEG